MVRPANSVQEGLTTDVAHSTYNGHTDSPNEAELNRQTQVLLDPEFNQLLRDYCQIGSFKGKLGVHCDVNSFLEEIDSQVDLACQTRNRKDQITCVNKAVDSFDRIFVLSKSILPTPGATQDFEKLFHAAQGYIHKQDEARQDDLALLRLEIIRQKTVTGNLTLKDLPKIDYFFHEILKLNKKQSVPSKYFTEITRLYLAQHVSLYLQAIKNGAVTRSQKKLFKQIFNNAMYCIALLKEAEDFNIKQQDSIEKALFSYERLVQERQTTFKTRAINRFVLKQAQQLREITLS